MVIEMDLKRDERTLVQKLGEFLIRYGLVIVLGSIGFPALSGSGGFLLKDVVFAGSVVLDAGRFVVCE